MKSEYPWEGMTAGEVIGTGSYGSVCGVTLEGKPFALKHLRVPRDPEEAVRLARKLGGAEQAKAYCREAADRLLEETRILERLKDHPNIVAVQDVRLEENETGYDIYILMERLEPFTEYGIRHSMGESDVLRLGIDLCRALEACEQASVLHRDLKPDNILVTEDGTFKVCDFGVARLLEKTTSGNSVRGTFAYMAPEVYYGRKYGRRADIYSLGMILYVLMNRGRDPFVPQDRRMVHYMDRETALNRRMDGEALPAPAEASEEFTEILMKACAFYPEKRYTSASALKEDLIRLQNGTYKKKRSAAGRYAKRKAKDYLKSAAAGLLILVVCAAAGRGFLHEYRARYVNCFDPEIREKLEERYAFTSGARLDGNGVLYLETDLDLCATPDGEYPWASQKDRIRKIVFGEQMTRSIYRGDSAPEGNSSDGQTFTDRTAGVFVNEEMFCYCKNLEEVSVLGKTFRFSGFGIFRGDDNLEKITCIPEADITLSGTPFSELTWLTAEEYRMLGTTLIRYNGTEKEMDAIPAGTRQIAEGAFMQNGTVEEVFLPDSVRVIGGSAFLGCANLKSVRIPEGLVKIGESAFQECSSLEELSIPSSVSEIGSNAFIRCPRLRKLDLSPDNGSYVLEDGVLYDAAKRELLWCAPDYRGTLSLPEGLEAIRSEVFTECGELSGLVIPDSLAFPTGELFGHCHALTEVSVSAANPFWTVEGPLLLSKDGTQLSLCIRDASGSLRVPDGVSVIRGYAFASCTGLTEVVFPDSVRFLFQDSFTDCTNLETIRLPGGMSFIGSRAFAGCGSLRDIWYGGSKEEWEQLTARSDIGIDEERTEVHFHAASAATANAAGMSVRGFRAMRKG